MAIAKEKLKYYFACESLGIVMGMHHIERLEVIIPREQFALYMPLGHWLAEEAHEILNMEPSIQYLELDEADKGHFRFQEKLFAATHKLSDEMCWISEDNFLYFIFCQFMQGTLIAFEQLSTGVSPYYTDEDKPDFKGFIEFLDKKVPSDAAAKAKVEAIAQELTERWRQEIDQAVVEYHFPEE